jgi:tetratricopeptide (TPR) repeat protein
MRLRKPSPQILLNYGMILHALNRIDETLASFDAALKQKSRFAEAHNNRGAALADLGRTEEALECFNKAIALKMTMPTPTTIVLVATCPWAIRRGASESRSRAGDATKSHQGAQ